MQCVAVTYTVVNQLLRSVMTPTDVHISTMACTAVVRNSLCFMHIPLSE
jgi:hypothetical protein